MPLLFASLCAQLALHFSGGGPWARVCAPPLRHRCVQAQGLLDGTWRLVYTANSEVLALLSLSQLPLVTVEDITQTVDGAAMTVENKASALCALTHVQQPCDCAIFPAAKPSYHFCGKRAPLGCWLVQVVLSGPLARTSFAANASVEVRSPKLLQVQFREGRLATPELLQVRAAVRLGCLGRGCLSAMAVGHWG